MQVESVPVRYSLILGIALDCRAMIRYRSERKFNVSHVHEEHDRNSNPHTVTSLSDDR